MILGKIDPVLSIAVQNTLFNPTPEYITGSYIAAFAERYVLGSNKVNFRVIYGNCTFENGEATFFRGIHADNIILSGSAIDTWGTDDTVILGDIATMQGTNVIEFISGSSIDAPFL